MRPQNAVLGFVYDAFLLIGWFLGSVRQSLRGRHVRWMEAEVTRLTGENRALWQSIWAQNGHGRPDLPPIGILTAMTGHPEPRTNGASEARQEARGNTHRGRPSWPQMQASFEDKARKALVKEAEESVAQALRTKAPSKTNGASQEPPVEAENAAE